METDGTSVKKHPFHQIGSRLKRERENQGLSQEGLAEKIGTTQVNISRWESGRTKPGPYFRQKLSELFGKSLPELGFDLDQRQGQNTEQQARDDQHIITNVPFGRNPFFTGREEILERLYTELHSHRTAALTQAQAISGLGGIGKTQIAVEYAYRYQNHYNPILWTTASSRESLTTDFIAIASLLNLAEKDEQDQAIVINAIKRWLADNNNWLLILDNVENPKEIADFLPSQSGGNVLITTRLQALGLIANAKSIEVEKMGKDEGILFLLRRTKALGPDAPLETVPLSVREQAARIVHELDGLPLALDQAAAYIEETQCGFQGYLNRYHTRRKELLKMRSISSDAQESSNTPLSIHPEPVSATWSLSFQK